jgi:hypothetical protein
MLDLRRLVEPLPFGALGSDGLGAQDHHVDCEPVQVLRLIKRPLRSRARSTEDAYATSEDPAGRDRVAGTTLISREARGGWNVRVRGTVNAIYHRRF